MRGEPRDLRAEPPNCAPAAAHAGPSGGAQIRLFCRAAPGVAVPHQAEPWTPPISKCGRAPGRAGRAGPGVRCSRTRSLAARGCSRCRARNSASIGLHLP